MRRIADVRRGDTVTDSGSQKLKVRAKGIGVES
jgi:hypothetical protein